MGANGSQRVGRGSEVGPVTDVFRRYFRLEPVG
jgi:hypothetical protein